MKKFLICLLMCGASLYGEATSRVFWWHYTKEFGTASFVRSQCEECYEVRNTGKSVASPCAAIMEAFIDVKQKALITYPDPEESWEDSIKHNTYRLGLKANRPLSEIKAEQDKIWALHKKLYADWSKVSKMYSWLTVMGSDPEFEELVEPEEGSLTPFVPYPKERSIGDMQKQWEVSGILTDKGIKDATHFVKEFRETKQRFKQSEDPCYFAPLTPTIPLLDLVKRIEKEKSTARENK